MSYEIDMENMLQQHPTADNFGTLLLCLIMKADAHNLRLLKKGFPNAVVTIKHWRETGNIIDLPYD